MGILVCAASGFSFLVVLVCFQSPGQPIRSFVGLTSDTNFMFDAVFTFNCGASVLGYMSLNIVEVMEI